MPTLDPVARARRALSDAGVDVEVFSGVRVEPTDASFMEAARFAREQLDYAAEHLVIAASYQWHPFGLELGDAAMRVVMPDFTRHPALSSTPW